MRSSIIRVHYFSQPGVQLSHMFFIVVCALCMKHKKCDSRSDWKIGIDQQAMVSRLETEKFPRGNDFGLWWMKIRAMLAAALEKAN